VIDLSNRILCDEKIRNFVETIIEKGFGKTVEINDDRKLVNLLPILNLQDDIERLKLDNEHEAGENAICYLNELNIYINNVCKLNCAFCNLYSMQTKSCFKNENNVVFPIKKLKEIFDSLQYTQLKNVNILGGNIFLYPHFNELLELTKNYDFSFHFWVHIFNAAGNEKLLSFHFQEIIITFPIDKEKIINFARLQKDNDKITYHFLIENDMQYIETENIINEASIKNFQIAPIFTGINLSFFQNNIYLSNEDILGSVVSQRIIFCNQKLNSNFFGKLYILPDGNVRANLNAKFLGNIFENSVIELIAKELTENTVWRKTRNEKPCSDCLYQFICPPPSNYEIAIDKPNLCNVKK
ncbi:MAG: TIGR04150 pseudo-rSAM protein, partial [Paludibacter sp.]|nr:TIGR04150 pseudo-rSAM protein [Paludibacter sp.]